MIDEKNYNSRSSRAIRYAKAAGYTINKLGDIFSPDGVKLKQHIRGSDRSDGGYWAVSLPTGEKRTATVQSHRFVVYVKYGDDIFNEGLEVRHYDNDNKNNSYDNLLLGTKSQNRMDAIRNGANTKKKKVIRMTK